MATTSDVSALIPKEYAFLCLDIQVGRRVSLGDTLSLLRSGLVRHQKGQWILTNLGVRSAALARNGMQTEAVAPLNSVEQPKENDMAEQTVAVEKSMLSMLLREQVERLQTPTRLKRDIVAQLARGADLADESVDQFLSGALFPISNIQLSAFAQILGLNAQTLFDLYARDAIMLNQRDQIHLMAQNMIADLFVFKQANGQYRWTIISSSAYEDADKEIVTKQALVSDVARADKEKLYGPLLWWHSDGAVLGQCDFNAMTGPDDRFLVESGTFDDPEVAMAVEKSADRMGVSLGFDYPESQRDSTGAYWKIQRRERSLLPKGKASNRFTGVSITKEQQAMNTSDKYQEFVSLFADPNAGHAAALRMGKQVMAMDQQAKTAGVANKAATQKDGLLMTGDLAGSNPVPVGADLSTADAPNPAFNSSQVADTPLSTAPPLPVTPVVELEPDKPADQPTSGVDAMMAQLVSAMTAAIATAFSAFESRFSVAYAGKSVDSADTETLRLRLAETERQTKELQQQIASLNSGLPPMAQMFIGDQRASQAASTVVQAAQPVIQKQMNGSDPFLMSIFGGGN